MSHFHDPYLFVHSMFFNHPNEIIGKSRVIVLKSIRDMDCPSIHLLRETFEALEFPPNVVLKMKNVDCRLCLDTDTTNVDLYCMVAGIFAVDDDRVYKHVECLHDESDS